jgi:hypothetical protein
VRHLWLTTDPTNLRGLVLRIYWDDRADTAPSVAVPLGDFFCTGWPGSLTLIDSKMVVVDAVPAPRPDHPGERARPRRSGVLPGQLRIARVAGACGVPARAVAAQQPGR